MPEVTHTTEELDRVGARLLPDALGKPLEIEPRILLRDRQAGKPFVRVFISYAHDDQAAHANFAKELAQQLASSNKYTFQLWDDGQLIVGERWHEQIRSRLHEAHLGVLLVSHAYLASEYVVREELTALAQGQAAGMLGKRVVPVALQALSFETTDLKGLDRFQIFHDHRGKAFADCRGPNQRKRWISSLVGQIFRLLDRYASVPADEGDAPLEQKASAAPASTRERSGQQPGSRAWRSREMLCTDFEQLICLLENEGRLTTLGATLLPPEVPADDGNSVQVVEHLLAWLRDVRAPSLFALLGEYGMGKTITCQRVVRELEQERARGDSDLPEPLYFDLRKLTGLRSRSVPTLPEIIDECIARGWQLALPADGSSDVSVERPTARELIALALQRPLLFVFDGLDEALVHLSEVDGQVFTRELLRLQPRSQPSDGGGRTRLLISCRTHYFRSLHAQNNHFTGQERDTTPASDYRALVLLPLNEAQIRTYFQHALPGLDVDATLDLVRSVHDLTELSSRPYTLKLVTELIPQLEAWRARGKAVLGVTLYRAMVQRWLQRDSGKHHLLPEHKERLMTHLAAWMWRRGERLIAAVDIEEWFHEWLEGEPDLSLRYRSVDRDKLEEDLRTATFLVREDGDGGAKAGFRFAHTSMHEFFLALYLFEAVRRDRRGDWQLPAVGEETLGFLAQLLREAERPALLQTLSGWRAPYHRGSSELWLSYALLAHEKGWPAPLLQGVDMRGSDLRGWRFSGLSPREPINLSGASFEGALLCQSVWRDVRVDGATFERARLQRMEWLRVRAVGARFAGACCDGATFRQVQWPGSDWAGCEAHRAWFLQTHPRPQALTGPANDRAASEAARGEQPSQERPALDTSRRLAAGVGHSGPVWHCCFAPDGLRALSASQDLTLKLWDARSGRMLATWQGHTGRVTGCDFSPDATLAISSSWDKTLCLWDVATGRPRAVWTGHTGPVNCCAFSPDGARVVSGALDGSVRVWDVNSGRCLAILSGHTRRVDCCTFSPDGARVLSSSADHTLKLWQVSSGRCLSTWTGHSEPVNSCAFAPDGTRAVSASDDKSIKLWDTASGICLATWMGHDHSVTSSRFSPDGSRVVSTSWDTTLRIWDPSSGACLATWTGHGTLVLCSAYSPDGQRVLSSSYDQSLWLWDASSGADLGRWLGNPSQVTGCEYSPDGKRYVATVKEDVLALWDARSGACQAILEHVAVAHCAFSPKGDRLASASHDGSLALWDVATGRRLTTWSGHERDVSGCRFSPDGSRLLSVGQDDSLRLWDAASGRLTLSWAGHSGGIRCCVFSPDGSHILSGGNDGALVLWNAATGARILSRTGHRRSVTSCSFSPSGAQIVSASQDGNIKLWDRTSGKCVARWPDHEGSVTSCAFAPDGSRVVSASHDGTIKFWNISSGHCLATWSGHDGPVTSCAFAPDGRRLISGGADGTLLLWDVKTGALLRRHFLQGHEHATCEAATSRLTSASDGAWRWLVWQELDEHERLIDVHPYESVGSLEAGRAGALRPSTHDESVGTPAVAIGVE